MKGSGGVKLHAVPFKVDYSVTREQLLAYGVSARIIDLAESPFMRPAPSEVHGVQNFDMAYALSVWDARDVVSLAALRINNPDKKAVFFPPHAPYMGHVK